MIRSHSHRFLVACLSIFSVGAAFADSTVPITEAGMEWQLLSRAVARVQTPARVGTGFLIANDFLVTSAAVVEGVPLDRINIVFADGVNRTGERDVAAQLSSDDSWRALSMVIVPLDACANAAVLRLAPKAGVTAGELFGYLGARADDPLAGEPAHIIAVTNHGKKSYMRADALLAAEGGVCHPGGPLSFAYQSETPATGDGAPVLDDGGCLIGLQCASGGRQALAININHLRKMMPDNGCQLETCMLGVEYEYHFDVISGTTKDIGGVTAALPRHDEPRVMQSSTPSYDASSLEGLHGRGIPPFDYPDHPPGYREVPPPVSPDPPPHSPDPYDPRRPEPPDDPNHPVPEPGTILLLVGAGIVGVRYLRRGG
jgi:hypothetical protein